jgi:hypothetical protein
MSMDLAERRVYRRYPLHLPVRYRLNGAHASAIVGTGLTQNLSSAGVAIASEAMMDVGSVIDLWVSWPVHAPETNLELRMTGRVVRSNGAEIAIHVRRHDFVPAERPRHDDAGGGSPPPQELAANSAI